MTLITVVVPLYKGQKYINSIIRMIENNIKSFAGEIKVELIFVNDYPQESVKPVSHSLDNLDVVYIENDKNVGIHKTKIYGLQIAHGEYILFLDQDDTIAEDYFMKQLTYMDNCDAVYCNGYWRQGCVIFSEQEQMKMQLNYEDYLEKGYPLVSLGQMIIRKRSIPQRWTEYVLEKNGWDDHFLWMCIASNNLQMMYNPHCIYTHEEHEDNESFNWTGMKNAALEYKEIGLNFTHDERQLDKFVKVVERKIVKYECYIELDYLWKKIKDCEISDFFVENAVETIAIYGMGIYGKKLYNAIDKNRVKVLYGIDRAAHKKKFEIPIYEELPAKNGADIVVCATGYDDECVRETLKCNAITIRELLKLCNT